MTPRDLTLSLIFALGSIYLLASYFIDRIGKTYIRPKSWNTMDIIEKIQNLDFNGVWLDSSTAFDAVLSNFNFKNGTAHMRVFVENTELSSFRIGNTTFGDRGPVWLQLRLNDGFGFSTNKYLFNLKFESLKEKETQTILKMRRSSHNNPLNAQECELNTTLKVIKDRLKKTKTLEDLSINLQVRSETPGCQTDLTLRFNYNSNQNSQRMLKFLAFSFLSGLFEMVLLFYIIGLFERNENMCKSQGVIFWTSNAMFSCLFCFINISGTGENVEKMLYFFMVSMIHFVNFALIILRILHIIRRVQLSEVMANNVFL